jgi:epsin
MQQQQALMQQQALQSQPTGYRSNNPFAPMQAQHTAMPSFLPPTQQPTPQVEQQQPSFLSAPTTSSTTIQQQPSPQPQAFSPVKKKEDGEHAHLANLLANRDGGMDTFGNVGNLRECSKAVASVIIQRRWCFT